MEKMNLGCRKIKKLLIPGLEMPDWYSYKQIALCNPAQTAGSQCSDRNASNMTKMSLSGEANFRHFYFGQAVETLREEVIKLPVKKLVLQDALPTVFPQQLPHVSITGRLWSGCSAQPDKPS